MRAWADFTDMHDRQLMVQTWAQPGEIIDLYDYEGNTCRAEVSSARVGEFVGCTILLDTWAP